MNVSLPFASPARKQDTTNNNKKGQPHDTCNELTSSQLSLYIPIIRIIVEVSLSNNDSSVYLEI